MHPITSIVFFRETPFTERYYERLGIETLQKNGFKVEAWDFTPFLSPQVDVPGQKVFSGHRKFLNLKDAIDAIAQLLPSSLVVCTITYQWDSLPIYRALSRAGITYAAVVTNKVPVPKITRNLPSILDRVKRSSARQLLGALFSRIPFRAWGIRPAMFLLAGGAKSIQRTHQYPMDHDTKIIWAHTRDYDVYLNERDRPVQIDQRMGVFLDEYLPFHPDYVQAGLPPPSGPDSYFPALRRFFDLMEHACGLKIVIAAHPSANYDEHADYFGGRQIVKGKTLELIRKSSCVIAHESTALNFAVLFRKPLLFITTDEIERNPREARFIHAMASWLGKTVINADTSLRVDWEKEQTVDRDAYARYREAYIKKDDSPDKSTWQILADYLKTSEA